MRKGSRKPIAERIEDCLIGSRANLPYGKILRLKPEITRLLYRILKERNKKK